MSRKFNKLLRNSGMVLSQPRTRSTSHSMDINTLCQDINLELLSVSGTVDGEGDDEEGESSGGPPRRREPEIRTEVDMRAARIISQMERNSTLMHNNPLAEHMRLETLKELPQSLTIKRAVKANLIHTVSLKNKTHPIGCCRRFKYRLSITLTRFKMWLHDVVYSMELWYSSVKTIEGHFGSDVASYFKFLRWLFLYNLMIFILSSIFVVIPQLIYIEHSADNGIAQIDNILTSVSDVMTNSISPPATNMSRFSFFDIITGEGFLTNTTLYYGFFTDQSLKIGSFSYSIPTAYFFTAFFSYLFVFITLSVRMARSYRKSFIETSGGLKNVYALKIFCAWDFSIANENAARLKSESIVRGIREMLAEDIRSAYQTSQILRRFYKTFIRCSVNVLFVVILITTGALVYTLLNRSLLYRLDDHTSGLIASILPWKYVAKREHAAVEDYDNDGEDDGAHVVGGNWQVEPVFISFIVTVILVIMPLIFSLIVRFEEYRDPRISLYITMLRTFVLECVVVAVLVVFWLERDSSQCWETCLGQAVYRLVVMDFLLSGIALTCAEFLRNFLQRSLCKNILTVAEFDISRNTLNLIYNQTLFWVGFYFSPMLSLVIVVKLFFSFYIKKVSLLYNCVPSTSSNWRTAQTQTLFLVLSFVSLLAVLMTHGYIITSVRTSDCGPLKGSSFMYERILEGVFQLHHGNSFWTFVMFLTKPGVVAGLLLSMGGGVYYLREKSLAQMKMVEILRGMLVAESKDKEFLLQQISFFTGGRKSRPQSEIEKFQPSPLTLHVPKEEDQDGVTNEVID